jgi:hypothetical protein
MNVRSVAVMMVATLTNIVKWRAGISQSRWYIISKQSGGCRADLCKYIHATLCLYHLNSEYLQASWEPRSISWSHTGAGWFWVRQWRQLSPHLNISELKISTFISVILTYELLKNNLYRYASLEAHKCLSHWLLSENIQYTIFVWNGMSSEQVSK